jgi:hypothetical protein
MRLAIALLFAFSVQAITIPTIAGIASLAASSGQIVREGHDLCTHFKATMKKHGRDLRRAVQGKPAAAPVPVPVQMEPKVTQDAP